jgi:hypothetical protein
MAIKYPKRYFKCALWARVRLPEPTSDTAPHVTSFYMHDRSGLTKGKRATRGIASDRLFSIGPTCEGMVMSYCCHLRCVTAVTACLDIKDVHGPRLRALPHWQPIKDSLSSRGLCVGLRRLPNRDLLRGCSCTLAL